MALQCFSRRRAARRELEGLRRARAASKLAAWLRGAGPRRQLAKAQRASVALQCLARRRFAARKCAAARLKAKELGDATLVCRFEGSVPPEAYR